MEMQFLEKCSDIVFAIPPEIFENFPNFDKRVYTSWKSCFSRVKAKKRQLSKKSQAIVNSSDEFRSTDESNVSPIRHFQRENPAAIKNLFTPPEEDPDYKIDDPEDPPSSTERPSSSGNANSTKNYPLFERPSKPLEVSTPKVAATSSGAKPKFQPKVAKLPLIKQGRAKMNESNSEIVSISSSEEIFNSSFDQPGPSTSTWAQPTYQPPQTINQQLFKQPATQTTYKQKTAQSPMSTVASSFDDMDLSESL